jgi:catechol 2,3-dioxygenase-like lactoylglutathione lyase family enzyme
MATRLDHLILNVNDREKSLAFYTRILGFAHEGEREGTPFSVIKVEPDFMLQLALFGTRAASIWRFRCRARNLTRLSRGCAKRESNMGTPSTRLATCAGPEIAEGRAEHASRSTSSTPTGT